MPTEQAECQNCDWKGPEEQLHAIHDIRSWVQPGDIMPAGDCPECGAFCHIVTYPKRYTVFGRLLSEDGNPKMETTRQEDNIFLQHIAMLLNREEDRNHR